MRRIIVLGASGYVGSACVRRFPVMTELPTLTAGRHGGEFSVDLATEDFSSLTSSLRYGDTLIFLAAISSPDLCAKESGVARRVNVENTISLIEQLTIKGVRVVFCSSDAVMGGYSQKSYDESPVRPSGAYAEMKGAVEMAVEGNPFVKIARFSLVIGSGDKFTEMLRHASRTGDEIEIFSGFKRNVVSIDDVTEGLCCLAENWEKFPQKVFNFSGPELVSRERLVIAISDMIPSLRFRVTEASESFWNNRERVIETDCHNFSILLGRPPRSLRQIIDSWVN